MWPRGSADCGRAVPVVDKCYRTGQRPAVKLSDGIGLPVVVTRKLPFTPTVKLALLVLVIVRWLRLR